MRATWRFTLPLTFAFAALTAWLAVHHEPWRDEMQAWLIARDSPDLRSLLLIGRYEGTPPLWHLLLRPLALLTDRPQAMQALQAMLAILFFFSICRFAPFSRLQKVLLLCNYYLLFEYGTVCRQYLAGALLLGFACMLLPRGGRERPWAFAFCLIGAALLSIYSLILAGALAAAFWGPRTMAAGRVSPGQPAPSWHPLPLLAVAVGFTAAAGSMLPAPDAFYAPADAWHFQWDPERAARAACAFTNAQFLLPRPDGFFWIPAWLTDLSWPQRTAIALALPLFAWSAWSLRKTPVALLFYLFGAGGTAAFVYVKYLGFPRHDGFFFLSLFFGCWLHGLLPRESESQPADATGLLSRETAPIVLTAVLAVQSVTGLWAGWLETTRPFSAGRNAAREIVARGLDHAALAAWPDPVGAVAAGWLGRSVSIYLPQSRRHGSFTHWNRARREDLTDEEALALAEADAGPRPLVIVLDHPLTEEFIRAHGLHTVGAFTGSLASFEDCYVYSRDQAPPAAAPLSPREKNG